MSSSRINELERKVQALWPPLKTVDLLIRNDSEVNTAIVNGTAAADSLDWDSSPYPSGAGGSQVFTPATGTDANVRTRPGGIFSALRAQGLNHPVSSTALLLDQHYFPGELLRPFQALPDLTAVAAPGQAYVRQRNMINVRRISCKIRISPNWALAEANAGTFATDSNENAPYLLRPARIMFMWVRYDNWSKLQQMYRTSPTNGSAQTSAAAPLYNGLLPRFWLPRLNGMFQTYWERIRARQVRSTGLFDSDVTAIELQSDQSFDELIWHSKVGVTPMPNQPLLLGEEITPPFTVLKSVRFSCTAGIKSFTKPGTTFYGDDVMPVTTFAPTSAGLTSNVYEFHASAAKNEVYELDMDLDFGYDGKDVEYWSKPYSPTMVAEHSGLGLCKDDLRLICVSNRNHSFWTSVSYPSGSGGTSEYTGRTGIDCSISFRG